MTSFRSTTFFVMLLVALGAFAVQGSMQQPGQTPQQPGQAQQPGAASPSTQQPGNMSPSATPQTPGGVQNPQTEPSQRPMHSGAPTIDDQVSSLASSLNLSSDQQAKVKSILEDQHQQVVTLVGDNSLSQNDKLQKVLSLRQATIGKVRNVLTSDEQKQKFDTMVEAQNQRLREREQQPGTTNPSNPSPK